MCKSFFGDSHSQTHLGLLERLKSAVSEIGGLLTQVNYNKMCTLEVWKGGF